MKKFISQIRVIYADTDAMGIVYHTNYIKWFEIGRTELLRQIDYTYARMESEGIWLPLISVSCNYKVPAVYDDLLEIHTWTSELKSASVTMSYEIFKKETGQLLVTGHTRHAITDSKLKPLRLKTSCPDLFERIINNM